MSVGTSSTVAQIMLSEINQYLTSPGAAATVMGV
jgi:hypothetical protein